MYCIPRRLYPALPAHYRCIDGLTVDKKESLEHPWAFKLRSPSQSVRRYLRYLVSSRMHGWMLHSRPLGLRTTSIAVVGASQCGGVTCFLPLIDNDTVEFSGVGPENTSTSLARIHDSDSCPLSSGEDIPAMTARNRKARNGIHPGNVDLMQHTWCWSGKSSMDGLSARTSASPNLQCQSSRDHVLDTLRFFNLRHL